MKVLSELRGEQPARELLKSSTRAVRGSSLRRRNQLQIPDNLCAFIGFWNMKIHVVVLNQSLRIREPFFQLLVIPNEVRRLESRRIIEARGRARLPPIDTCQVRTFLVAIERVAA